MLDLRASSRGLNSFQQRFLDDGLPATLSRDAFEAFDASKYDAAQIERGRKTWTLRALDEYRSLIAFTSLLDDIARVDLPFDALGTAIRVVRDEHRHVELCRRFVVALGGTSNLEGEPSWVRRHPWRSSRERVLRAVVGSLCIGETLSVRFLAAARDLTSDPLALEAATCLVADESVHSRFGWMVLEGLLPKLTKRERRTLDDLLPKYLRDAERAFVPEGARSKESTTPHATPFGALPARVRADLFDEAFEHDVVARFELLDLPARRAAPKPSLWSRFKKS